MVQVCSERKPPSCEELKVLQIKQREIRGKSPGKEGTMDKPAALAGSSHLHCRTPCARGSCPLVCDCTEGTCFDTRAKLSPARSPLLIAASHGSQCGCIANWQYCLNISFKKRWVSKKAVSIF